MDGWAATEQQIKLIKRLCLIGGDDSDQFNFDVMTREQASATIDMLNADLNE